MIQARSDQKEAPKPGKYNQGTDIIPFNQKEPNLSLFLAPLMGVYGTPVPPVNLPPTYSICYANRRGSTTFFLIHYTRAWWSFLISSARRRLARVCILIRGCHLASFSIKSLLTFQEHMVLSIRRWTRGTTTEWWP